MKLKLAIVSAALMAIGAVYSVGCGSSACDDYKTELEDCCATLEGDAATQCQTTIDAFDFDNADDDACQAAADAFECPTGGAGGSGS